MTRSIVLGIATLGLLCGCATHIAKPPPVCDGRHLRPANPYGSVLQPTLAAPPTAQLPPEATPAPAASAPHSGDPQAGSGGCGS